MTTDLTPAQELNKQERLMKLVELRRNARSAFTDLIHQDPNSPPDRNKYNLIGDYHDGAHEGDYVSPYTKSGGNLDADVMVLLQDWSSHHALTGNMDRAMLSQIITQGRNPSRSTNKNLDRLLKDHFNLPIQLTYATNLFTFVKSGEISNDIPRKDMVWAAKKFARPQIEIIRPKIVICCGLATFNAMREAYDLPPAPNMTAAMDDVVVDGLIHRAMSPIFVADDTTTIWCQAHPGQQGQNLRGAEQVSADWQRMAQLYRWLRG